MCNKCNNNKCYGNCDIAYNKQIKIVNKNGRGSYPEWEDIQNKPSEFPPSYHTHEIEDINGLQEALDDVTYTFENGLREDNGTVKLGLDITTLGTTNEGLLTERTVLALGDIIGQNYTSLDLQDGSFSIQTIDGLSNAGLTYNTIEPNVLILGRGSSGQNQSIVFSDSSFLIVDEINQKGLEYTDDYSTEWTDHSLVTKKWVTDNFSDLELGETDDTAFDGERGKIAYDHSQIISGNPHGTAVGDVVGLNDALSLKADKIGTDAISVRQNIITPNTSIQLLPSADIYIRSQSSTASRLYNSTPGTLTLSTTFAGNTGTLTLNSNGNVSIPNGYVFQYLLPIHPNHLTNKQYVDDGLNIKANDADVVHKSGDTMTGTLQLVEGTTTVAPAIIPEGDLLTTPIDGAIERDEDGVYITEGATRKRLATDVDLDKKVNINDGEVVSVVPDITRLIGLLHSEEPAVKDPSRLYIYVD